MRKNIIFRHIINRIKIDKKECLGRKMNGNKKNIAIIILSIALLASGFVSMYLAFGPRIYPPPPVPPHNAIIVGTPEGPTDLDPIKSWDSDSNNVIEQVCEGLYMTNLTDPNLGLVPMLAADYGMWDVSAKHLTIPLRQGALFHDGTNFNASSVRWTFERINYFINASGMPWILNETISKIHSLWEFPNGTSILGPINPVSINSEYSVTINLRGPYAILESLLCYVTAFMLSPQSTPKFEYISTAYGKIVGTGPFVYDYYIADTEVKFHRWDNYWRLPAFFEILIISVINDATRRYEAIKSHTVDYLIGSPPSFISSDYSDPTLTYRSDLPSLSYCYLGMNNQKINKTWRQAISYAINYTYIIEELKNGNGFRSNGPLAPNFPMYDPTIKAATYNVTKAREIVVNMGFGDIGWTDAQWQAASFATWNYTYYIGHDFREDLAVLLQYNLNQIGVTVIAEGWSFADFIGIINFPTLEWMTKGFFWIGWGPDYLDPFNMLDPLFNPASGANSAQVNDTWLNAKMASALSETDDNARNDIYKSIQWYMAARGFFHALSFILSH